MASVRRIAEHCRRAIKDLIPAGLETAIGIHLASVGYIE
jgi:hypothetical protein